MLWTGIKYQWGLFKDSKIYKTIEPIFKNNTNIDTLIGHSAGGSAALELEKIILIEK